MRFHGIIVAGLALMTACSRDRAEDASARLASDSSLGRDLQMATQTPMYSVDSISSVEGGAAAPVAGAVGAPALSRATATTTRRSASSSRTSSAPRRSTSSSSGGDVSPAPSRQPATKVITEKNTKRDAAIGAAAGAAIGAATSRDKLKGAVIGAAAGAVIGGIIGNNVDVKKRRVPADP
jgi:hypothetical protein